MPLTQVTNWIYRKTVIADILRRAGTGTPDLWRQWVFGWWLAAPYLVVASALSLGAIAGYLMWRASLWITVGGWGVALVGIIYSTAVNPSVGGLIAVRRYVQRSRSNNVRPDIIVNDFEPMMVSVDYQVGVLSRISAWTGILLFLAGVLLSLTSELIQ